MTLHVNATEAVWVALNLTTLVLTIAALLDALSDRAAVKLLNGHARELAATGIVRRESFRVIVQALLLAAILPELGTPGGGDIHPTILALMAVPVVLLTSSVLDARDRGLMTSIVTADILAERVGSMARIEQQNEDLAEAVHENTVITKEASAHADSAYKEANAVNEKIASQGAVIVVQGEAATLTAETIRHTAEQVDDIHQATV